MRMSRWQVARSCHALPSIAAAPCTMAIRVWVTDTAVPGEESETLMEAFNCLVSA